MSLADRLFGRRLATHEEEAQKVGPLAGIPMLGLDALSSSAYGPEAALTLLLPLGALGVLYIVPITAVIIGVLVIVYFSYRQTIAAYPMGGGSYTVAKENLGTSAGLLAAAALMLDYMLNVAVGISAGVGALVSAFPILHPYILPLCLSILVLIALINLRGVRESGLAFLLPTYLFVGCLLVVLLLGAAKALLSGGHPMPVDRPPPLPAATSTVTLWLLLRAFASGCTAMTGVEAVSNGVSAFRNPAVVNARRTLTAIVAMLIEGAERFGLAQLHQFRGRVGRGIHQSYCILVSDKENDVTKQRLEAMEETRDGFRLAEIDLELRGPGEFFGTRQSGTPDLKVAQLADTRLLHAANLEAQNILADDPRLEKPEQALLKAQVDAFWADVAKAG